MGEIVKLLHVLLVWFAFRLQFFTQSIILSDAARLQGLHAHGAAVTSCFNLKMWFGYLKILKNIEFNNKSLNRSSINSTFQIQQTYTYYTHTVNDKNSSSFV